MEQALRNELLLVFPYRFSTCDIDNVNSIADFISNPNGPYKDMGPRHLSGIGRSEVGDAKRNMFLELARRIQQILTYPVLTQVEYDEWHRTTCIWLDNELSNLCLPNTTRYPGKAQKLINISLKHLFCCQSLNELALNDSFRFFHMTLDRYVLSWYYREVLNEDYIPLDSERLNWGKMNYDVYFAVQQNVRNFLNNAQNNIDYRYQNRALTAFETEFYVWNEEKTIRAAEELKLQLLNDDGQSSRWMKCSTMRSLYHEIVDIIPTIQERG